MYQNNPVLQLLYKNNYYIGQVFKLCKMYYCSSSLMFNNILEFSNRKIYTVESVLLSTDS